MDTRMEARHTFSNTEENLQESLRVPTRGALRSILDDYAKSNANQQMAKDSNRPRQQRVSLLDGVKEAVQGVLRPESAGAAAPANHGAREKREALERLQRMEYFESQDFDPVENDVERAAELARDQADYAAEENWRWLLSVLIGLTMGLCSFIVDISLETLNNWKFKTVKAVIKDEGGFVAPYLTFICFCMGYATIAGCLVSFGAPLAAGSGIPEVKTYLNGVHIKGLLSLKTLLCKLTGICFSMAGGLIAGKEGPFVHSGGIVGGGIAGMGSKWLTDLSQGRFTFRAPRKYGGYFRNDADHRDFVSIGTAAGVSTAFAAPIGGLLLAIEEGASFLTLPLFWRGFLSTCTGVLTLHFLVQLHESGWQVVNGKFGIRRDLGLYDDNVTEYGSIFYFYIWEVPIFLGMGIIAGTLGALFNSLHIKFAAFRAKYIPPRLVYRRLAEVVAVAWLTGTVFFTIIYNGPCRKLPPAAQLKYFELSGEDQDAYAGVDLLDSRGLRFFPRLWCAADEFNEYGQLFFNPLIQAMRMIVHFGETLPAGTQDAYSFSAGTLVLWAVSMFCLMLFSFGIGAPTGIFIPSLAVGAAWGRVIGLIVNAFLIKAGLDDRVSLPAYAVIGSAAMLGGVTRMTISITLLAMEGTGSLQLIIPLMLAIFAAKIAGDTLTLPIYDIQIKIRGAPVLMESGMELRQRMTAEKLTVSELVTTQLLALPPVVQVRELVATLQKCRHQAFPVTPEVEAAYQSDAAFPLHGVVKRTQLLRMLKHRIGMYALDPNAPVPPSQSQIPGAQEARYELLEQLEQFPLKVRAGEDEGGILADLSARELEMAMDLRPWMQRTPFIIHGNASLARAYRLFRTMGLHHLYVGPPKPPIIGVLTRKDVTEETAEVFLEDKVGRGLVHPSVASVKLPELPHMTFPDQERTIARVRSTLGNTIELRPVADEDTPRSRMGEQARLLSGTSGGFVYNNYSTNQI